MVKNQKPFQSYFGGKGGSGVYQAIINQIPPHSIYAELFVGNGSIYRFKKAAQLSILADLSQSVVEGWKELGVKGWLEVFDMLEILLHPHGSFVFKQDAIDILSSTDYEGYELDSEGCFIYLDPPYLFSTRKDQRPTYEFEMSEDSHYKLLDVISCYKKAMIMISSYPNDLYDKVLSGWRYVDFQAQTRGGIATERIYMNYDEPTELHDYQYYGSNYRERWALKKSTTNIINKFKRMSPLMRNAVLHGVISELKDLENNA